MSNYWAVTDSLGDTPDEPIVVLKSDGPIVHVWAPHLNKWMEAPIYLDSIFGDDRDAVSITENQAAKYRADGIGLTPEGFDKMIDYQDKVWDPSAAEPAQA